MSVFLSQGRVIYTDIDKKLINKYHFTSHLMTNLDV